MHIRITSLILAIAGGMVAASCARGAHSSNSALNDLVKSDSIPASVKSAAKAIADNDSVAFAALVSYPLERPYPLRDIENAEQMRGYYKTMVDDSLRNVVTQSGPDKWSEYGWRGWSIDDGRYIWIDDDAIYDVEYISAAERDRLNDYARHEIASLPENMRRGWTPVICLKDKESNTVYRIDAAEPKDRDSEPDATRYRLSVYNQGANLKGKPSAIYYGVEEQGGSAINRVYSFGATPGNEILIETDCPDSESPLLIMPDGTDRSLEKAYWRELL